jgi:hypothetical protein
MKRGVPCTLIIASIWLRAGSMRSTEELLALVSQIAPNPAAAPLESYGTRILAVIRLLAGSLRTSVLFSATGSPRRSERRS